MGLTARKEINQLINWVQRLPVIPVIGNGSYSMSPVYIGDVVSATVEAVFQADTKENTFDLVGPEDMTLVMLIDRLSAYFGVRVMKLFLPVSFVQAMASLFRLVNINTLVSDQIPRLLCDKPSPKTPEIPLLNYRPRKLEKGLRLCFSSKD